MLTYGTHSRNISLDITLTWGRGNMIKIIVILNNSIEM